jgi:phospholipase C
MGYYDGNTVTALWNYAQHFAMNDDSFGTTFGPSTPGAINLISGNTHGATPNNVEDHVINGTVIGDADPKFDDCSRKGVAHMQMVGKNVGLALVMLLLTDVFALIMQLIYLSRQVNRKQ